MKPIYSPATVQFRAMKEKPIIQCDGTLIFPWATFFANGFVHTWDNNGVGGENWNANDYPDENKYLQALARTSYKNPAPFLPGEKCYLAEHLHRDRLWVTYADGQPALNVAGIHERWEWMMSRRILPPQSMPLKFARRFFTIVSCVPVRVSEVTEEDIIKAGLADGSCEWASGAARCDKNGNLVVNQFMDNWHQRHPGKEWAWRIEIEPSGNAG